MKYNQVLHSLKIHVVDQPIWLIEEILFVKVDHEIMRFKLSWITGRSLSSFTLEAHDEVLNILTDLVHCHSKVLLRQ